ncbi:MAG TPA: hypothetical protein VFD39_07230, partial [Trueperaceae bacterium]|nr:hypothetical protein [Trueperaceae bacterium]
MGPLQTITPTHEEIERFVVRALCCHRALEGFRTETLAQYKEPTLISAGQFAPGEGAVVIVREGHGAVGMKDAHTRAELAEGAIPFRLGVF